MLRRSIPRHALVALRGAESIAVRGGWEAHHDSRLLPMLGPGLPMSLRWIVLACALLVGPPALPQEAPATQPAPAVHTPAHRPLRQYPDTPPAPTEPETFAGYAQAPPFKVVPQKDKLKFYPCSQCHKLMPPNPQPRKLEAAPHPAALQHGKGRMWCVNCHLLDDRDFLHTVSGQKIDFDEAYLLCGQCHFNRQKDWYFGGHGKRAGNWTGERLIYSCTHCHDPHDPVLKPQQARKVPPVRAGLQPMQRPNHKPGNLWDRQPMGKADANER